MEGGPTPCRTGHRGPNYSSLIRFNIFGERETCHLGDILTIVNLSTLTPCIGGTLWCIGILLTLIQEVSDLR